MSQLDLKIGPKIKVFRRQLGIQANKLAAKLKNKDENKKNQSFKKTRCDSNNYWR